MSKYTALASFIIILAGIVMQQNSEILDMGGGARRKRRWLQGLVVFGALVMVLASTLPP